MLGIPDSIKYLSLVGGFLCLILAKIPLALQILLILLSDILTLSNLKAKYIL